MENNRKEYFKAYREANKEKIRERRKTRRELFLKEHGNNPNACSVCRKIKESAEFIGKVKVSFNGCIRIIDERFKTCNSCRKANNDSRDKREKNMKE